MFYNYVALKYNTYYQYYNVFEVKTLYFLKVLYRTLLFLSWSFQPVYILRPNENNIASIFY